VYWLGAMPTRILEALLLPIHGLAEVGHAPWAGSENAVHWFTLRLSAAALPRSVGRCGPEMPLKSRSVV
jgi:hypothetical protein